MTEPVDPALPLIRTKLAPPRIGSAPVKRKVLLDVLEQHRQRKLHLLVGPAGCGKTSVLVQWRRQRLDAGDRVAWYSADADDDDLRAASYLVEALRHAGVNVDAESLHLFRRSGGSAWQHLLASLVNDCADLAHEAYLVIDNFQHLTSFTVLQLISRWIALAPPTLHFVIATRVSPPLDLARLRAENQLMELSLEQLRFNAEESRRFVVSQGMSELEPAQLDYLHAVTDGWPAGLQLLTFSMRQDERSGHVLQHPGRLSIKQAQALDEYLAHTVTGLLEPAQLEFLTHISVCRQFNRALCEAVSGDSSSVDHLRRFESENLFLLPIDTADAEPWYRFHPLFASFLDKRLRRRDASLVQDLHRRAACWFAEHHVPAEALHHAAQSTDPTLLVTLIDQYARRLTNAGHYFEYLRWCELAPAELLTKNLNVSLNLALSQLSCNRLHDFKRTITAIERHPRAARESVHTELQLLKAYYAMRIDDPVAQRAAIAEVQRQPPSPDSHAGLMQTSILCHEHAYAGQYEAMRDAARQRFRGGETRLHVVPLVDFWIGFSYLLEGRLQRATQQLREVITAGRQFFDSDSATSGLVYGYLMEVLYQSGQIDETRELLDQQLDLVEAVGLPDSLMYAYRVRARIERLDGDDASALKTLQALEERGLRLGLERLVVWSLYEQLRLAIEISDPVRADELRRRIDFTATPLENEAGNVRSEIGLAAALARAEYALAFQPREPASSAVVQAAIDRARRDQRRMAEIHAELLRVCMLVHTGQQTQAVEAARAQIRIAMSLGMQRVIADLAPPQRAVLCSLATASEDTELADFTAQQNSFPAREVDGDDIDVTPFVPKAPASTTVGERVLTVREREILGLLGRALSTKSIARELALSPGTVKWHLSNIYGKLGAYSKEDALAKARQPAEAESRAS